MEMRKFRKRLCQLCYHTITNILNCDPSYKCGLFYLFILLYFILFYFLMCLYEFFWGNAMREADSSNAERKKLHQNICT